MNNEDMCLAAADILSNLHSNYEVYERFPNHTRFTAIRQTEFFWIVQVGTEIIKVPKRLDKVHEV